MRRQQRFRGEVELRTGEPKNSLGGIIRGHAGEILGGNGVQCRVGGLSPAVSGRAAACAAGATIANEAARPVNRAFAIRAEQGKNRRRGRPAEASPYSAHWR